MQNLFDAATAKALKERAARLTPESQRQWGRMNAAQAVAHCADAMELALGDRNPPRLLLGRLVGRIIKPMALGNEEPLRRNTPTLPELVVKDPRDLDLERRQLFTLIDRFVAAGPAGCTRHPHSFFGPLTSEEWGILMYKHLDHHLRQFGT